MERTSAYSDARPVLQGLYGIEDLKYFTHISFVTSDQLWISDRNGEREKNS